MTADYYCKIDKITRSLSSIILASGKCIDYTDHYNLPSFYMQVSKQQQSSSTSQQFEATLGISDAPHTEEPDHKMEANHEDSAEKRSLERKINC